MFSRTYGLELWTGFGPGDTSLAFLDLLQTCISFAELSGPTELEFHMLLRVRARPARKRVVFVLFNSKSERNKNASLARIA